MTTTDGAQPIFDKKEQFEKIHAGLLLGEQIEAVLDMKGGGTGFLGITNKRLIVYDKARWKPTLSQGVAKKTPPPVAAPRSTPPSGG